MLRASGPAAWLRSLSARMVLINTAVVVVMSGLMILFVCELIERFMQFHLEDTVLDEVHVLEATHRLDGLLDVARIIDQRLRTYSNGRQAYLLVDREGRKLAGNLDAMPTLADGRTGWYSLPTLHQPVDATLRIRRVQLPDRSQLAVGYDDWEITEYLDAVRNAALVGMLMTLVVGLLAGALATRLTLRQIDAINRTASRIIDGDLKQRVPLRHSGDEFDRLGGTLNEMLDRIDELMNSVRYANESIAHDLRSPLTRLRYRIEAARLEPPAGAAAQTELFEQLGVEVDRVLVVFASLLRLATIESGVLRSRFQPVALAPLVDDALSLYEALAAERDITLSLRVGPGADGITVSGDRDLLFQAICNLLDNAIKFSPDGQPVHLELAAEERRARIRIRDQGPGIPADQRERVFDRLVRLDASRGSPGFGLGLSLVRGIARLHDGDCRLLDGAPGTLAVFEVPLAD